MRIFKNYPLKSLNTFRTGGYARFFCIIKNIEDLKKAISFSKKHKINFFILGGGSNILISDTGFSGLVIKNEILGRNILKENIICFGAGEKLDESVSFSVKNNLFGLENLSYIPGTVGGSVVQNIGAYGAEIKNFISKVEVYDSENGKIFEMKNKDCNFSYRNSIFKIKKNLVVLRVYFFLSKKFKPNFSYSGIIEKIKENRIKTAILQSDLKCLKSGQRHFKSLCSKSVLEKTTAMDIRNAVISIRKSKLPEVSELGSAGSFFKNPIINKKEYTKLKKKFPDIPGFPEPKGKIKISLAWVLDKICNLKNYKIKNVGLYKNQPLVLVNFGGATTTEIINLSDQIKKSIKEKTQIKVEEEVIHIF
jgi:UDP-N-acetylmuramate dehydrogenase